MYIFSTLEELKMYLNSKLVGFAVGKLASNYYFTTNNKLTLSVIGITVSVNSDKQTNSKLVPTFFCC